MASPSRNSVQICFWPLADAVRTSWRPAIVVNACQYLRVRARAAAVAAQCSASLQAGGRVAGRARAQVSTARHSCWGTNIVVWLSMRASKGV